jgi:hypothetical protein
MWGGTEVCHSSAGTGTLARRPIELILISSANILGHASQRETGANSPISDRSENFTKRNLI